MKTVFAAILVSAALQSQSNPSSDDARQTYALIKPSLLRAAEKMPEEFYAFRTVPEVRTFGEMIAHVADGQLRMCAVVKGEQVTANASSKKTKADLVAALQASFDYCDPIYSTMTDAAGAAQVRWARWDMSKLGLLNWNISHDNEMYGIIGAFLRIKHRASVERAAATVESKGCLIPNNSSLPCAPISRNSASKKPELRLMSTVSWRPEAAPS